jgi:hypothetical protein
MNLLGEWDMLKFHGENFKFVGGSQTSKFMKVSPSKVFHYNMVCTGV